MSFNEKMTAIADAIRSKTGGTAPLTLDQMAQEIEGLSAGGYDDGYAKGEADGYEKGHTDGVADGMEQGFEEGVLSVPFYYAQRLNATFQDAVFPENYECVIRLQKPSYYALSFYNAKNLKSVKMIADDTEGTTNLDQFVRNTTAEFVDFTEYSRKVTSARWMALNATELKSIYGAMDWTECAECTLWLNSASKLEDVEFVPGTIKISIPFNQNPNLTDASIQSIIDGLADLTGATAQTVTFHKNVGDKLTDAQKTAISAKNWTLAY